MTSFFYATLTLIGILAVTIALVLPLVWLANRILKRRGL